MIKKVVLLIVSIVSLLSINAKNKVLMVSIKNGGTEHYILTFKPVITFEGDSMAITTDSFSTKICKADIESMYFDESNGISNSVSNDIIEYTFMDNIFTVNEGKISVYNASGTLLTEADKSVSLQDYASGIYFIKVNNKTFKIIKK